ncbi:MAG TPA: hypothetical protein VFR37_05030 [Longimicrobium sp.]|nr:hypothetical protein [Longimicrobium sp.]
MTEDEIARVESLTAAAEADTTATGALRLFRYLGHLYIVRSPEGGYVRSSAARAGADEALDALMHRHHVEVVLESGRRVRVTGRAYSSLLLMAAHGTRVRALEVELEHCEARFTLAVTEARRLGLLSRCGRQWRRRMRAVERIHARYVIELARQRLTLWAHALTPDGAPCPDVTRAPAWLHEITAVDEALLFDALNEVGPRRIAALMEAIPKPRRRGPAAERPDFGPDGLLAAYGYRLKVRAADCYDDDLGRLTAELLIAVPEPAEALTD